MQNVTRWTKRVAVATGYMLMAYVFVAYAAHTALLLLSN